MIIPPANRLEHVQEYYFARKLREIRSRNAQGEDIINLGIGNPDMMPSASTLDTLLETATQSGNHGYQPYKGSPILRNGFQEWYLRTYGVQLDPESELLPLIGSKEGIMHISMAFLNPGDQVLVPNPGYPTYSSVSRLVGATMIPYHLSEGQQWKPDFDQLETLDLNPVKIMWVNYPHMPTGTPPSDELFKKIIAFGKKHQILICHDNPYSLVLNDSPKSILAYEGATETAIELNSLSKSHNMAGWRVGVLAGAQSYINTVLKVKSNMDSGMFLPAQLAAAEALKNGENWHEERNQEYAARRELIWKILESLQCDFSRNQAGMFVWAKIPVSMDDGETFSERILNQAKVFLTPGFIFGSEGDQYIRASLCCSQSLLKQALDRILSSQLANV
ncbi:MAG: aminotransferase class I/II-fold pyridoxal phosphate-dependent enzyme [Bacteroidota bacterium]